MKKVLSLLCALLMAGTLAACGGDTGSAPSPSASSTPSSTVQPSSEMPDTQSSESPSQAEPSEAMPAENGEETNRILVVCFSATGNTQSVAEIIAARLNADIHEIVPEEPYSSADLDYNDSSSRSSVEMNDPAARPGISSVLEGIENYDVVFLGYPIWWGEAPRIINTFLESYDFSGKTIIPFCTSSSSGMGSSARDLQSLTPDAVWMDGQRFGESPSQSDVTGWVDGLGLAGEAA